MMAGSGVWLHSTGVHEFILKRMPKITIPNCKILKLL